MLHGTVATTMITRLFLLGLLVAAIEGKQLPKFIKPCKRGDPKLNACVLEQVARLRPRLLKGIPELKIPPYDPIEIPHVRLEQGTDAVKLIADFNNIRTFGARNAVVEDIRLDLKNLRLDIDLFLPKMRIKTKYTIDGKVLVLPVKGSGASDGNFTDVSAKVGFRGKYIQRKGEQYIDLQNPSVRLKMKGAHMYFDNFFNGNKELIETTNRFVNQNWEGIVKELTPVLEETIGSVVYKLVKYVFDNYSFNELLPP